MREGRKEGRKEGRERGGRGGEGREGSGVGFNRQQQSLMHK